ncbi:MAG: hypothetical protein Q8L34_04750 [Candidatus Woesearchaeota archaeon]|nr:hypothetical protein [Candidatus Woesearchaeota archaeon]
MTQSYQASYTINGGATGHGGNYPAEDVETRTFQALDDTQALYMASWYAHFLSMNHLLGPDGQTVVSLDTLVHPDGSSVNQAVLQPQLERTIARLTHLSPEGTVVVRSTFQDHVLYELVEDFYAQLGFLEPTHSH